MDDDTLMARTARGEEAAFRLLVERWERDVRNFLIHMLGSVEEGEDALQDTFIKVFSQADRYRAQGQFRSWLFRIAGNQARSRLRRRRIIGWVRFESREHDLAAGGSGPLDRLERDEERRTVQAAIATLPARQRQALVLHRFQGLKYSEVADAMETTVPGVESLIQRAMAALKKRLAGEVDRT